MHYIEAPFYKCTEEHKVSSKNMKYIKHIFIIVSKEMVK